MTTDGLLKLGGSVVKYALAAQNVFEHLCVLESRKPVPLVWRPSLDIIIPSHHGTFSKGQPHPGLQLTIAACELALMGTGLDWRYFIVSNGNPVTGDFRDALNLAFDFARQTGHVGQIFDIPEAMSPPSARNLGAAAGTGEVIFFLDDHVQVKPYFFHRMLQTMDSTGCATCHGATEGMPKTYYHYALDLERTFWGKFSPDVRGDGITPYRVAQGAHGAFACRRSVWQEVGGYWNGFRGWGGEESEFNLKLALLDYESYLNPCARHWHHFPRKRNDDTETIRGYKRLQSEALFNFCAAANIVGGEQWARKILDHQNLDPAPLDSDFSSDAELQEKFVKLQERRQQIHEKLVVSNKKVFDMALAESEPQAEWMRQHRKRTLDEQLELWKEEGVAA